MKKLRLLGLWLVGLIASASGPNALAQTEAEASALSQRPLTAAEIGRRATDCALPTAGEDLTDLPSGIPATKIEMPDHVLVGLFFFDSIIENRTLKAVEVLPELPMGGIGERDICTSVVAGLMNGNPSDKDLLLMTWRLRPGLDLAADYPTAAAQIRQNDQILFIPASPFAVIEIAHATQAGEIVAKLATWDRVKTTGFYLVTKDKLYVPIRD
ncbi:MAG: hypothetical protein NXI27_19455 [Alphaproteobacteria bacterium]|nr:hypothetical protein [Alphaproteobacteria bacterium]